MIGAVVYFIIGALACPAALLVAGAVFLVELGRAVVKKGLTSFKALTQEVK